MVNTAAIEANLDTRIATQHRKFTFGEHRTHAKVDVSPEESSQQPSPASTGPGKIACSSAKLHASPSPSTTSFPPEAWRASECGTRSAFP